MKIFITIIPILILSCALNPFRETKPKITDFFPRDTDVPGWEQIHKPFVSKKGKLMNRGYKEYGISLVASSKYRSFSNSEILINIRIIKCASPLYAFGLFSIDRGFIQNGGNVKYFYYTSDKGGSIRAGNYYIKIDANKFYDDIGKDLKFFFNIISLKMKGSIIEKPFPQHINAFDEYHSKFSNLIFYKDGYPNFPEVKNLFLKRIDIIDKKMLIFYSKHKTSFKAIEIFNSIFNSLDNKYTMTKINTLDIAYRELDDNKIMFISKYKEWIFGVMNAENIDEGSRIIKKLFTAKFKKK